MSFAPDYTPSNSFADDESNQAAGRSTVKTDELDAQFADISSSVNAINVNIELNQRDDGEIRDQRVKLHTLASDVLALLTTYGATPRGAWLTATAYALKDLVSQSGNTYIAVTAHTSGVFATDLAAGRWLLFTLGTSIGAGAVVFAPTGTIASTNVQAAIDEADTENRVLSAAAQAAAGAAQAAAVAAQATATAAVPAASLASTASPSVGTGLLGWLRAATGAVASTLYAWLDWQNVHVFEFMTLAQRVDWKARTKTLDVTSAIQAAIDHVSGQGGGKLIFATGAGRISGTLQWKSYIHGEGQYGENTHSGVTAETGVELAWYGAINTPMVRFFNARLFGFEGFVLNGRSTAGSTGILLDCTNAPSGSQNEISKFSIRDCAVGVQWGTSGIAGGSYANDGTRFSTFTIWSSVAGSWGFVVNSGNAGQMSVIEGGGIQCQTGGIDLVVSNILQIRRVFGGGVMDTAFIRASVAIDTLIEGCASENWGVGRIWRTNRSMFLKVVAPAEAYPMIESTITMSGNQINNPIEVGYPARITSTGDAWGYCKDYTTAVDEPARGNFIAAPAWSAVTAYVANLNAVSLAGVNYQCILNNTNQTPPNATYWRVAPSYVVAMNNGVAPGSTSLTTNEPTMGWIDSAYVALSNLDPGRGWVRPAFNAASYTTNGAGGWTVQNADVEFYGYTLLNRTMTVSFSIVATSVIAAVGNELRIAIPNGKIASQPMANPVYLFDAGAAANGFATVVQGATYITVKRLNAANFTASVNATEIRGQITFMVD